MIVGCDATENYLFFEIHKWYKWLDNNVGKLPSFYIFLTGAELNNLIPDNVMELIILKWKCACGSSFSNVIWKLLSLKMSTTLRVGSSGSAFCRNYQRTKACRS